MINRFGAILVAALLFPFLPATPQSGKGNVAHSTLTAAEKQAVIQAIEDEIYDWDCQRAADSIGKEVAKQTFEVRVYFNPRLENGNGEIIYKFMPFGEIYRSFAIGKSGTAYLEDNPSLGFRAARPSYKTVFMDDDELCKDKNDWQKSAYVIQWHPSSERLRQARERQHKRLGEMDYGPYKDCPI